MPKREIKKERIIEALMEDTQSQADIAEKFSVSQGYVSQLLTKLTQDRYLSLLRSLYNIMNVRMSWNGKPTKSEVEKIKEVQGILWR